MAIPLKNIKESLIEQLEKKGVNVALSQDLIEDYCFFCRQEQKMQADIRKRGHEIKAVSAQGKEYTKENPSIKNAAYYSKQKLAILSHMGLTTTGIEPTEVDDDSGL